MNLFPILRATLVLIGTLGTTVSVVLSCEVPSDTLPLQTSELFNPQRSGSGIEGQVFLGSLCPVLQVGVECPNRPYQATITVLDQQGQIVIRFQTDTTGKFQLRLKPGKYTLRPESPGMFPQAAEQTINVIGQRFTAVQITYDSGIR